MDGRIQSAVEGAWDYIWRGLFCNRTNLFYDYRTSLTTASQFSHLPYEEEIRCQFPNPCGWGTGMEDSMLNAGSVLDILRLRNTHNRDSSATELAAMILQGMKLCTEVHGRTGFVARSVSPRDGRSCYSNSSRDQFTLCVYGAWRFLREFPDAPDALRTLARDLLVSVARYCAATISEDSDDLLRLDGKPALVCTMVQVQPHEALRLPMIYAAAWDASDDEEWHTRCEQYLDDGINRTLTLERQRHWNDWELVQMQISLELLQSVESDAKRNTRLREAKYLAATLAEPLLAKELTFARDFSGDWDCLNQNWRTLPFRIRPETLRDGPAFYSGYPYLLPQFREDYHRPYWLLRATGNLVCTLALCQEYDGQTTWSKDFLNLMGQPDYTRHGSDGPVNLLHGYWLGHHRGFW